MRRISMPVAERFVARTVFLAVAISMSVAGCNVSAGSGGSVPRATTGADALQVSGKAREHLYVADNGTMWEYPIIAGIPSSTPSNTLAAGGNSFAVGSDALLYALDDHYNVSVYARGATGIDPPIRTLYVGGCCTLAVNARGYLFVLADTGSVASVYAPGAQQHDSPIVTFSAESSSRSAAFDRRGNLYLLWGTPQGDRQVTEYADVVTHPHPVATFCFRRAAWSIATDDAGEVLLSNGSWSYQHRSIMVVAGGDTRCPVQSLRRISAKDAPSNGYFWISTLGTHLFATHADNSSTQVYTFDVQRGRQTPLSVVSVPPGVSWTGVGP
jgi:hypothetical protein